MTCLLNGSSECVTIMQIKGLFLILSSKANMCVDEWYGLISFVRVRELGRKLTDVTAETEPWTDLNVCAHCSARRSWTACKRRSMRINQSVLMRCKDRYGCLFLHSSFFAMLQMSPPRLDRTKYVHTHTQHTMVAAAVVSFYFLSLLSFFFLSSHFFIFYTSVNRNIYVLTQLTWLSIHIIHYMHMYVYTYGYNITQNDSMVLVLLFSNEIFLFAKKENTITCEKVLKKRNDYIQWYDKQLTRKLAIIYYILAHAREEEREREAAMKR